MRELSLLHDMALFVKVARSGGFSRVAEQLGMPAATTSRRIAAMERGLGYACSTAPRGAWC
jgi:DNA-binding transcriptional LysR family regulator